MEVLAGVSSVTAVVSLAIELGGKIKKLCEFWDSVQDAPREIRNIAQDLNIISQVLDSIGQDADTVRPHTSDLSASLAALEQCGDGVESLQEILRGIEPGFASTSKRVKKWTAFKTAWKGDKLRIFRDELRDMKITLVLARQNFTE